MLEICIYFLFYSNNIIKYLFGSKMIPVITIFNFEYSHYIIEDLSYTSFHITMKLIYIENVLSFIVIFDNIS